MDETSCTTKSPWLCFVHCSNRISSICKPATSHFKSNHFSSVKVEVPFWSLLQSSTHSCFLTFQLPLNSHYPPKKTTVYALHLQRPYLWLNDELWLKFCDLAILIWCCFRAKFHLVILPPARDMVSASGRILCYFWVEAKMCIKKPSSWPKHCLHETKCTKEVFPSLQSTT